MPNLSDRLTMLSLDVERALPETAESMNAAYQSLYEYIFSAPDAKTCTKETGILIIGGGIVGIMTAFFLRRMGYDITVVEKQSFGAAASGRNGGGILALGRDLPEIPFVRISIDLWENLSRFGVDTKLVRSGHVMVAMNDHEAEKLQKAMHLYGLAGLDVRFLPPKQVIERLPDVHPDNKGALYSPVCAQGYPFTAMASMISLLRRDGVRMLGHCEVTGFETRQGRITGVRCGQGLIRADSVILCAGPWTSELGKMLDVCLPITPRRSQIMATEILGSRRIDPFVSGNGLYLRQTHVGNVLYGGGGPWEVVGYDTSNSAEVIKLLSTRLIEMFPAYRERQLIRAFAGTVEITPDHLPLFGAVAGFDNLYVSAGYNGHGYGMSAVSGKMLAQMIYSDHHDTEIPVHIRRLFSRFAPSRFAANLSSPRRDEVHAHE